MAANPKPPPALADGAVVRRYGEEAVADAAALIRAGQAVAVPTETVYGLAADATNRDAVASIYAAKGRPAFNPLIVHVPTLAAAAAIGQFNDDTTRVAQAFWPGPLTLIVPLRADAGIASLVTAGLDTIALRVPSHRAMQALLMTSGVPLAAPSANASGRISPTTAAHVAASLGDRIPLILDDGPTSAGLESTIVHVSGGTVAILRPGPVTAEALAAATALSVTTTSRTNDCDPTAPGQLSSHYAPSKPLRLDAVTFAHDEFGIGFGGVAGDWNLSAEGDPVIAAARLFDALHRADASDRARIAVAPIPSAGLGHAIRDRLARAAH